MDAQLHLKGFVADEGREGMVVGEIDEVEARLAAAGIPGAGLLIVGVPVAGVTQLAGGAEALDVLHQGAGEADLRAGVGVAEDAVKGVVGTGLVGRYAVVQAEDAGQDFGGGMRSAGVLLLDGVPGGFVMVGVGDAVIGPVDGLVQVP